MMKQIRIYIAIFAAALGMTLACNAQARSPHAEISIVNDTNTQVSIYFTTERNGNLRWTWQPATSSYLSPRVRLLVVFFFELSMS